MRHLLCIIFVSIAVVINIPVLALMLGIIFVSIKSHRNLIAPSLGTKLLQAGIIIIGLTTTSSTAINLISEFFLQVSLFVIAVFLIGILLPKAFKINNSLGLLISSGTAICGATAIAAIAPIIKSKPKELLIALSIIFIFNAIAIVAFPLIGQSLEMSYEQFGAWSAMAIHDTGSVIGAAMSYGGNSAEVAATLKLGRTLWLIPLIIFLRITNNENDKFQPHQNIRTDSLSRLYDSKSRVQRQNIFTARNNFESYEYSPAIEKYLKIVRSGRPSKDCLLYTSPSPRDQRGSRMPSSA